MRFKSKETILNTIIHKSVLPFFNTTFPFDVQIYTPNMYVISEFPWHLVNIPGDI